MPFDPDEFIGGGGFDPDAFLGVRKEPVPRETAPPVGLDPNYQDQGPVDPYPTHATRAEAVLSGARRMVPWGNQLGAAMEAPIDALTRQQSLLDAYQKAKSGLDAKDEAAQREHPGYYIAGNVPMAVAGAVGTAAAIPAQLAKAAGPMATRFVSNLIPSAIDNTAHGGGVEGTAKDLLSGEAFSTGVGALLRPLKSAGSAIRNATSEPLAATAEWLGKSRIGRWLGEASDDIGNSTAAQQIKTDLDRAASFKPESTAIAGDSLPARLARSAQAGKADLGPNGFSVDPKEFGDDMLNMSREAMHESFDKHMPQISRGGWAVDQLGDVAEERIRHAEKDASFARRVLEGKPQTEDTDQVIRDLFSSKNRPAKEAQFEARAKTGEESAARMRSELQSVADRHKENLRADIGNNMEQARDLVSKSETAAQRNADVGEPMNNQAWKSAERGQNIARGRDVIRKGLGAGAAAGGALEGLDKGGVAMAMAGGVAGKAIGDKAIKAIDRFGDVGNKLSGMTSWAEKLAQRNDEVGRAAQWALSAQGDGVIARLAVLADLYPDEQ